MAEYAQQLVEDSSWQVLLVSVADIYWREHHSVVVMNGWQRLSSGIWSNYDGCSVVEGKGAIALHGLSQLSPPAKESKPCKSMIEQGACHFIQQSSNQVW